MENLPRERCVGKRVWLVEDDLGSSSPSSPLLNVLRKGEAATKEQRAAGWVPATGTAIKSAEGGELAGILMEREGRGKAEETNVVKMQMQKEREVWVM